MVTIRITKWVTFRDIFKTIVHKNSSLNDVQKMEYLKTHLQGEALSLVQHLTLNGRNYEAAFKILESRYENKRQMAYSHMEKNVKI